MEHILITTPGIRKALKKYNYYQALTEYVWNGFDANSTRIKIDYDANELGLVSKISISDDGYGIDRELLANKFKPFFESDKDIVPIDKNINSAFHGKNGVGRLTFFHFASFAEWETIYARDNQNYKYNIKINYDNLENYETSKPIETKEKCGTIITFKGIFKISADHIEKEFKDYLIKEFGWFLELNAEKPFSILINGVPLDYSVIIGEQEFFEKVYEQNNTKFIVKYILWTQKINNEYSRYYYINSDGNEIWKQTTTLNNKGDSFYHSVFIKSVFFNSFKPASETNDDSSLFFNAHKNEEYKFIMKEVDAFLLSKRKPFLKRYTDVLIDDLENSNAFPSYNAKNVWEVTRNSELENVVRELYQVEPKIFSNLNTEQKKTFVRFLDLIIDSGETNSLFEILNEIVELDKEERDELAKLLKSSRMSSIIKAIKLIRDRYVAIEELKQLVFNEDLKADEVHHLQKYIEKHYWIFGEQYHLVTAAEPKFEEALHRFTNLLFGDISKKKITHPDKLREMDIFAVRQDMNNNIITSIVVELKHPKINIGRKQYEQVKDYLNVVINQKEFNASNMFWKFYLVGKDFDKNGYIDSEFKNAINHGEKSLAFKTDRYKIYVKKWSEIFSDFELRHKFLSDKLELERSKLESENKSAKEIIENASMNSASNEAVVLN